MSLKLVSLFVTAVTKLLSLNPGLNDSLQYLKVPDWERGHACDLGLELDGQPVPV